jgi:hypothetical protein
METTQTCVRCRGITSDGTRCKRNTCVRRKLCWQHLRKQKGIDVRDSNIDGAAKGLVAYKTFKKGDKIARYTGEYKALEEAEGSQYALQMSGGNVIDSTDSQDGLARYANTCRKANKDAGECTGNNAKFVRDFANNKARIKANKKIKKGREIFVPYGRAFSIWRGA